MSPPLFDGMIVSRPSVAARSFRRLAGTALALSLHLTALGLLVLAPLLSIEMVQPPRASNGPITIFQPPPQGRLDGDGVPGPRVRAGGGAATKRAAASDRTSAARNAPPDAIQPPRVPLDPPRPVDPQEPRVDETTGGTARPIEGAPPGPGIPGGQGTSETGTDKDCDGCRGHGVPGDGTPGDDGDGPIYVWDSRVDPPLLIPSTRALPRYPDLARRAGVQGSVILMIAIEADGTVGEVQVLRSPNERWGFDESAIVAVKRWRYRPARMHGEAVAVYAQVMVEFTLSR